LQLFWCMYIYICIFSCHVTDTVSLLQRTRNISCLLLGIIKNINELSKRSVQFTGIRTRGICDTYDIFVNCNWVATRWQQYSAHIHTNNTQNDTKQTIYKTKQKLGRVRTVPRLCGLYPGICLTTEEKARENLWTLNGRFVCYSKVLSVAKIQ
jgi:hypothetical protein